VLCCGWLMYAPPFRYYRLSGTQVLLSSTVRLDALQCIDQWRRAACCRRCVSSASACKWNYMLTITVCCCVPLLVQGGVG
jgi:hypothetical protein